MKITVVYGTERKGSTYHIAQELIGCLGDVALAEVILPRDLPEYCISCYRCFTEEKGVCSHSAYTDSIREKLLWADVIVLTSPIYAFHVSGQMKVMLDHFANMWMVHRPERAMFLKQGVVIATAAGPVFRKTLSEMKDSLDMWGVSNTFQIGAALMNTEWDTVSPRIKAKLSKRIAAVAAKLEKRLGKAKPCFRVRKWFYLSRFMHTKIKMNPPDVKHWEEQGLGGKRPPWRS